MTCYSRLIVPKQGISTNPFIYQGDIKLASTETIKNSSNIFTTVIFFDQQKLLAKFISHQIRAKYLNRTSKPRLRRVDFAAYRPSSATLIKPPIEFSLLQSILATPIPAVAQLWTRDAKWAITSETKAASKRSAILTYLSYVTSRTRTTNSSPPYRAIGSLKSLRLLLNTAVAFLK